jgi:galactokinase
VPIKDAPVYLDAAQRFRTLFHDAHTHAAYAPGRFEVLGNHTDYNEGFVLSAATNFGTYALASPRADDRCELTSLSVSHSAHSTVNGLAPEPETSWANYVWGVLAGLRTLGQVSTGCNILVAGDLPLGAGLASSAALEISTGLVLSTLYGISVSRLDLARIGQRAEQEFVGANTGLLDQISSLHGESHQLVMTDFRTLEVETLPFAKDMCFVMCNTRVNHALSDGQYNDRRKHCEDAAIFFDGVLDHEVTALRDVSWVEWQEHHQGMDEIRARRCAHPIGENDRVIRGRDLLMRGDLDGLGALMYESHQSSSEYFENSCPELDFVVATARSIPGVLGARLSGGGFGGSAILLTHSRDTDVIMHATTSAYRNEYDRDCETRRLIPSPGASLIG